MVWSDERRRQEERFFVQKHEIDIIPRGQCWFLLDAKWMNRWWLYTTTNGPQPGPITNETLVKEYWKERLHGEEPGDADLPNEDLTYSVDYLCVTPLVWCFLVELHGTSNLPPIARCTKDIYSAPLPAFTRNKILKIPIMQAHVLVRSLHEHSEENHSPRLENKTIEKSNSTLNIFQSLLNNLPIDAWNQLHYGITMILAFTFYGLIDFPQWQGGAIAAIGLSVPTLFVHFALSALRPLCLRAEAVGAPLVVGVWLQAAITFTIIAAIPVTIWYYYFSQILGTIVQDQQVLSTVQVFSRTLAIGLLPQFLNTALTTTLSTQGVKTAISLSYILSWLSCGFMCYFFVYGLFGTTRYGATGVSLAIVLSHYLQLGVFTMYGIFTKRSLHENWAGWSTECFRRLPAFAYSAITVAPGISLNWICATIVAVLALSLGVNAAAFQCFLLSLFLIFRSLSQAICDTSVLQAVERINVPLINAIGIVLVVLVTATGVLSTEFWLKSLLQSWGVTQLSIQVLEKVKWAFEINLFLTGLHLSLHVRVGDRFDQKFYSIVGHGIGSIVGVALAYLVGVVWQWGIAGFWWAAVSAEICSIIAFSWSILRCQTNAPQEESLSLLSSQTPIRNNATFHTDQVILGEWILDATLKLDGPSWFESLSCFCCKKDFHEVSTRRIENVVAYDTSFTRSNEILQEPASKYAKSKNKVDISSGYINEDTDARKSNCSQRNYHNGTYLNEDDGTLDENSMSSRRLEFFPRDYSPPLQKTRRMESTATSTKKISLASIKNSIALDPTDRSENYNVDQETSLNGTLGSICRGRSLEMHESSGISRQETDQDEKYIGNRERDISKVNEEALNDDRQYVRDERSDVQSSMSRKSNQMDENGCGFCSIATDTNESTMVQNGQVNSSCLAWNCFTSQEDAKRVQDYERDEVHMDGTEGRVDGDHGNKRKQFPELKTLSKDDNIITGERTQPIDRVQSRRVERDLTTSCGWICTSKRHIQDHSFKDSVGSKDISNSDCYGSNCFQLCCGNKETSTSENTTTNSLHSSEKHGNMPLCEDGSMSIHELYDMNRSNRSRGPSMQRSESFYQLNASKDSSDVFMATSDEYVANSASSRRLQRAASVAQSLRRLPTQSNPIVPLKHSMCDTIMEWSSWCRGGQYNGYVSIETRGESIQLNQDPYLGEDSSVSAQLIPETKQNKEEDGSSWIEHSRKQSNCFCSLAPCWLSRKSRYDSFQKTISAHVKDQTDEHGSGFHVHGGHHATEFYEPSTASSCVNSYFCCFNSSNEKLRRLTKSSESYVNISNTIGTQRQPLRQDQPYQQQSYHEQPTSGNFKSISSDLKSSQSFQHGQTYQQQLYQEQRTRSNSNKDRPLRQDQPYHQQSYQEQPTSSNSKRPFASSCHQNSVNPVNSQEENYLLVTNTDNVLGVGSKNSKFMSSMKRVPSVESKYFPTIGGSECVEMNQRSTDTPPWVVLQEMTYSNTPPSRIHQGNEGTAYLPERRSESSNTFSNVERRDPFKSNEKINCSSDEVQEPHLIAAMPHINEGAYQYESAPLGGLSKGLLSARHTSTTLHDCRSYQSQRDVYENQSKGISTGQNTGFVSKGARKISSREIIRHGSNSISSGDAYHSSHNLMTKCSFEETSSLLHFSKNGDLADTTKEDEILDANAVNDILEMETPIPDMELCITLQDTLAVWKEARVFLCMFPCFIFRFFIAQFLADVELIFLGHLGIPQLAGAGLVRFWIAIPQWFLSTCMRAVYVLGIQSKQRGDIFGVGKWLQLALAFGFVSTLFVIYFYFHFADYVQWTESNYVTIQFGQTYAPILLVGLLPLLFHAALVNFMQVQSIHLPIIVCATIACLINIALHFLFIFGAYGWFGWGFQGSPWATVASLFVQALLFFIYTVIIQRYHKAYWPGWTFQALRWRQWSIFLSIAFPLGLSASLFWIACCIIGAITSYNPSSPSLNQRRLDEIDDGSVRAAAWVVSVCLFFIVITIFHGIAETTKTRMLVYIANGKSKLARSVLYVGVMYGVLLGLICACFLYFNKNGVFHVWTDDVGINFMCIDVIRWIIVCILLASMRIVLASGLIVLMKRPMVNLAQNIDIWCLQVPCSFIFPILLQLKDIQGFWIAVAIGESIHVLMLLYALCQGDPNELALAARVQTARSIQAPFIPQKSGHFIVDSRLPLSEEAKLDKIELGTNHDLEMELLDNEASQAMYTPEDSLVVIDIVNSGKEKDSVEGSSMLLPSNDYSLTHYSLNQDTTSFVVDEVNSSSEWIAKDIEMPSTSSREDMMLDTVERNVSVGEDDGRRESSRRQPNSNDSTEPDESTISCRQSVSIEGGPIAHAQVEMIELSGATQTSTAVGSPMMISPSVKAEDESSELFQSRSRSIPLASPRMKRAGELLADFADIEQLDYVYEKKSQGAMAVRSQAGMPSNANWTDETHSTFNKYEEATSEPLDKSLQAAGAPHTLIKLPQSVKKVIDGAPLYCDEGDMKRRSVDASEELVEQNSTATEELDTKAIRNQSMVTMSPNESIELAFEQIDQQTRPSSEGNVEISTMEPLRIDSSTGNESTIQLKQIHRIEEKKLEGCISPTPSYESSEDGGVQRGDSKGKRSPNERSSRPGTPTVETLSGIDISTLHFGKRSKKKRTKEEKSWRESISPSRRRPSIGFQPTLD